MSRGCPSIEDLWRVARSPESNPRRRHLESCPRCRALLASCREFLDPKPLPAEAGLAEAEAHLAAFLEREIASSARPDPERPPLLGRASAALAGALAWLRPRPARLALAAAVAGALFLLVRGGGDLPSAPPREPVFRGEQAGGFRAEARRLPSGEVEVVWPSRPGADGYRLELLGRDLRPRARLAAGADTLIRVGPDARNAEGEADRPFFYRVVVLRGGDVIAHSPTQPWPGR